MTPDRLLSIAQVEALVGLSRRTIIRLRAKGLFPNPIVIAGANRYSEAEVQAWIAEQKATAPRSRPRPVVTAEAQETHI